MTVSVKIQDRYVNKAYSHIDFHVFIDGECDGNLYRQTSDNNKFSKLLSYSRNNYYSAPARSSRNYFSIDGDPDYEDIILAMAESEYN